MRDTDTYESCGLIMPETAPSAIRLSLLPEPHDDSYHKTGQEMPSCEARVDAIVFAVFAFTYNPSSWPFD
ncbi:unnamed protein product [Protopolystoma xenopodis]|uniref:Uncharacterized protein n=1 Tax=Protopolystoma xenopodis TaxID=117903 RepID=A0A448XCE5_9PLAT|nr:unnamed protein product [Protopolystoma xenopodis]